MKIDTTDWEEFEVQELFDVVYLDCYGDPQELSFGDEGLDLLYKARRIEGSGEAEREVLQSYFFCENCKCKLDTCTVEIS